MGIVLLFQVVDDLSVSLSAFFSRYNTGGTLQVEQIVSCENRLKSVGNHDDGQAAFLLLLDIQNCILDFCLTFGV